MPSLNRDAILCIARVGRVRHSDSASSLGLE
jgi:hypothetical protein